MLDIKRRQFISLIGATAAACPSWRGPSRVTVYAAWILMPYPRVTRIRDPRSAFRQELWPHGGNV